jgi:hypothetical protein
MLSFSLYAVVQYGQDIQPITAVSDGPADLQLYHGDRALNCKSNTIQLNPHFIACFGPALPQSCTAIMCE